MWESVSSELVFFLQLILRCYTNSTTLYANKIKKELTTWPTPFYSYKSSEASGYTRINSFFVYHHR
jgi:hypothetical protein